MRSRLMILMALVTAASVMGCKEEPSRIPTVPTSLSLADGAKVEDLTVKLSAGGSTVEETLDISYVYYIGKSEDALEQTKAEVELEPYTQYFWCAQAKTEAGEGEKTEVRTFYCVPPFSVATDNGEGEYAAVIKWNNGDKFKSVTVSAQANYDGYELETQTITNGVDSCVFGLKRDSSDPTKNNAFVQYWDDEHGVYAEPVVYDFTVEATTQVGDKTFTLKNNAKECILDKQFVVRDHEYNVYRVVKIGNQTWLADDLRVKSFFYEGELIKLDDCSIHNFHGDPHKMYKTVTLEETGSTGVVYCIGESFASRVNFGKFDPEVYKLLPLLAPKGYHISTNEDWVILEKYYGIEEPTIVMGRDNVGLSINGFWVNEKDFKDKDSWFYDFIKKNNVSQGRELEIRRKMSSKYDWKFSDENETPVKSQTAFNAKPFRGEGKASVFYTFEPDNGQYHYYTVGLVRILSVLDGGIINYGDDCYWQGDAEYASIRCVKD